MFEITKSIHIDFAHHVRGHLGACINIHGHTWRFQVTVGANDLDHRGFVCDFAELKSQILQPTHNLLDHSFAIGKETFVEIEEPLSHLGQLLVRSRDYVHGLNAVTAPGRHEQELNGASNVFPGGIKVAVFDFTPTSEGLAKWFYQFARDRIKKVRRDAYVIETRVYETLVPVEAYASFTA